MTGPSPRSLVKVYAALMALLALTVVMTYLPLGIMQTPASLLIAAAKAALVAIFFMELAYTSAAVRLWALAGLYWLSVLLILSMADYATRR